MILAGWSNGWAGEAAELAAVAAVLAPLQIVYVDDMLGRWALRSEPRAAEPDAPALAAPREPVLNVHALAVAYAVMIRNHLARLGPSKIAPDPAEGEAPLPLDVLTPARLRAEAAGALRELFDLPAEAVGELMRRHVHLDLEARTVHVDVDRIAYAVLGDLRLTLD